MGDIRIKRVESLLKEKISEMILKNELKDPRLDNLITITRLQVTKDYKSAKVYISYFGDKEKHSIIVQVLNNAAGFIQSIIGKRIKLRNTPKLKFYEDHSIEKGFEITQKLKDLFS